MSQKHEDSLHVYVHRTERESYIRGDAFFLTIKRLSAFEPDMDAAYDLFSIYILSPETVI